MQFKTRSEYCMTSKNIITEKRVSKGREISLFPLIIIAQYAIAKQYYIFIFTYSKPFSQLKTQYNL